MKCIESVCTCVVADQFKTVFVFQQFTLVTTTHTTLLDVFSKHLRKGRRPLLLLLALCMVGFLIGMTICTRVRHNSE